MNLCADLHTHTIASGHAYGTIREMAFAAGEKKLELLGISEHAQGIPGTVGSYYYWNLNKIPRENLLRIKTEASEQRSGEITADPDERSFRDKRKGDL